MKIETLQEALAALETERELRECAERNVLNLLHYAKGKPSHVVISGPAIPVRDAMIQAHEDKRDMERKWEELTRALGAHGAESDPLTGSDTNDTIHQRAMERIREMVSDEF